MSQYDTGKFADYTPPPPPPRSAKSPWLWVGLGCGGLLLLGFGGCVAAGMVIASKAKQAMEMPYDPVAAKAALGDTPIYPGATQDINASKAMRMTYSLQKTLYSADDVTGVAFSSKDDFIKVSAWYDSELTKAGYQEGNSNKGVYVFQKGDQAITLQDIKNKAEAQTTFVVTRIKGAKRKLTN